MVICSSPEDHWGPSLGLDARRSYRLSDVLGDGVSYTYVTNTVEHYSQSSSVSVPGAHTTSEGMPWLSMLSNSVSIIAHSDATTTVISQRFDDLETSAQIYSSS